MAEIWFHILTFAVLFSVPVYAANHVAERARTGGASAAITEPVSALASTPVKEDAASEREIRDWFAGVVWKKFIEERDPRLSEDPVTREELDAFLEEAERGGEVRLSLDDLTRLVKYRDKLCESRAQPFGLDLKKGFQWD